MNNDAVATKKPHWTPVWDGLFADPSGKHHKKMGEAIWMFLEILRCCGGNGKTMRKIEALSKSTGVPISTTKRYLKKLRNGDYITTVSNGRSLEITVKNWRNIGKKPWRPPETLPNHNRLQPISNILAKRQYEFFNKNDVV